MPIDAERTDAHRGTLVQLAFVRRRGPAGVEERTRWRKCIEPNVLGDSPRGLFELHSIQILTELDQVGVVESRHTGLVRRQAAAHVARVWIINRLKMSIFSEP